MLKIRELGEVKVFAWIFSSVRYLCQENEFTLGISVHFAYYFYYDMLQHRLVERLLRKLD